MAGACVVRRNSRWVVVVKLISGKDLELALDYTLRCSGALAAADKGVCPAVCSHTTHTLDATVTSSSLPLCC